MSERLLLGFEADQIAQMIERLAEQKIEVKRTTAKSSDAAEQVTVGMSPWVGFRDWTLRRGEASQGEWAMAMRPTTLSVWSGHRPRLELDELDRFYGLYERSTGVFNVAGVLRQVMAEDWSQFDRLRFDVLVKGAPQTVHAAMEDEEILPPVVRSVLVKPGKWTTVEVDLKAAADQRGLHLTNMATLRIGFVLTDPQAAYVWQTQDGGRKWRGWNGAAEPGLVPLREMTHQAGRGDVVGTRADVMLLTNLGCNGPATAGPTLFVEIWCKRIGYEYREIKWTRFDGRRWSPVEVIVETKKRDAYNPTRPAVHAVSIGHREIFMVNALYKGILHYHNGRWTREADEIPPGSRISVAGDKHVVVIAAHGEQCDLSTRPGVVEAKGAVKLRAWHRLADGVVWASSVVISTSAAAGAKNDWAEGTPGRSTGATRDYYNAAGRLPWKNFMGDWRDAKGVAQGNAAYATADVADDDQGKFVEWDVTSLVRQWQNKKHQNQGFFLRTTDGGGTIVFCSREHADQEHRPRLIVVGENGSRELAPQADTYLTRSTYRSQGHTDELRASGAPDNVLIRFDIAPAKQLGRLSKATLRLYTTRQYGNAEIGVFRCQQGHDLPPSDPIPGLASRYPSDKGIAKDPHVVFATDFESDSWDDEWTYAGVMEVIDTVSEDAERKFQSLQGKALRVRIAEGSTGALNTLFKFKKETGTEPEEIYFRYYLRLGDDWNQTLQGGKMPGISGTYGVAGWGGRKVDGTDGWSARGSFDLSIPPGNPLGGLHPIGTYCYHADMKGTYGDGWGWHRDYRGFLQSNRWYSIEQYLKLNTPGRKDGILRAWVDGRLAFEKTDIRFRHVDKLKIEQIWMNVYHGGTKPSPYDQHLFIDNVVIAKKYIGPMKK